MSIVQHPPAEIVAPKGWAAGSSTEVVDAASVGRNVFDGLFSMPVAVLHDAALRHNSATMAKYCAQHEVELAPHGKTTMCPQLFARQLADGAWGLTAATVWQAATMVAMGVRRILLANEVTHLPDIRWLADAIDGGVEVYCYVDSLAGVALLDEGLSTASPSRKLPVLVEFGIAAGRTGVRTVADGVAVARAVSASEHLEVVGTSAFEGMITADGEASAHERIVAFLQDLNRLTEAIDEAGLFAGDETIVTAGGSAYFDLVVAAFDDLGPLRRPVRRILRSGNYLTHADGGYSTTSPMGDEPRVDDAEARLVAAMEVWGVVLSRPEPTRALVGLGQRDVSPDGGAPIIRGARDRDGRVVATAACAVGMNDQHLYLDLPADDPLAVGDFVAVGVRHGCTTFDKWRAIPIVDDNYQVVDIARTYF